MARLTFSALSEQFEAVGLTLNKLSKGYNLSIPAIGSQSFKTLAEVSDYLINLASTIRDLFTTKLEDTDRVHLETIYNKIPDVEPINTASEQFEKLRTAAENYGFKVELSSNSFTLYYNKVGCFICCDLNGLQFHICYYIPLYGRKQPSLYNDNEWITAEQAYQLVKQGETVSCPVDEVEIIENLLLTSVNAVDPAIYLEKIKSALSGYPLGVWMEGDRAIMRRLEAVHAGNERQCFAHESPLVQDDFDRHLETWIKSHMMSGKFQIVDIPNISATLSYQHRVLVEF